MVYGVGEWGGWVGSAGQCGRHGTCSAPGPFSTRPLGKARHRTRDRHVPEECDESSDMAVGVALADQGMVVVRLGVGGAGRGWGGSRGSPSVLPGVGWPGDGWPAPTAPVDGEEKGRDEGVDGKERHSVAPVPWVGWAGKRSFVCFCGWGPGSKSDSYPEPSAGGSELQQSAFAFAFTCKRQGRRACDTHTC